MPNSRFPAPCAISRPQTAPGRLRRLETWDRDGIEDVPLHMVVAGKPLSAHDVPITAQDPATQTPLFFLPDDSGTGWRQVTAANTSGDTRFIRLRWLKALQGDTLQKDAEMMQQSLSLIESYTYDGQGHLVEILRQRRETGFEVERVPFPAP
jgi:hypothetical protein